jgi:hypothetical protein
MRERRDHFALRLVHRHRAHRLLALLEAGILALRTVSAGGAFDDAAALPLLGLRDAALGGHERGRENNDGRQHDGTASNVRNIGFPPYLTLAQKGGKTVMRARP